MKENTEFLRQVTIFEDLADAEMESVAPLFKERTYKRNEVVFLEEDTGKYMYVIKKGACEGFPSPAQWQRGHPDLPRSRRVLR